MSLRPTGDYHCDRCGVSVLNGSAYYSTKVYGLDPDEPYRLRQLDLCIAERDGAPFGCTGNLLGEGALADYYETRNP